MSHPTPLPAPRPAPHPTAADLAAVPLFAGLPAEQLTRVAALFDVEERAAGERLTRQDESGYELWVLREGAGEVHVDGVLVGTVGPGDVVGELSLLDGPRSSATVRLTAPSRVWMMFGARVRTVQREVPEVAARLRALGEQRRAHDAERAARA